MKKGEAQYSSVLIGLGLVLALSACGSLPRSLATGWLPVGGFESNGERIYFTGTSDRGDRIRPSGGPYFGGMMTGPLTCASCHGSGGTGGEHYMHMRLMDAPDIRWSTLASGEHGDHEEHGEGETPYDEPSFNRTVREGVTPGGETLSGEMPRWEMSDADLEDLIGFLKILP